MKRISTAFAIALFTFCTSFAQSNFPFPTEYGEWVVYEQTPFLGPQDGYSIYRNILQGDSMFSGNIYNKVYRQNLCQCQICLQPVNYEPAPDQRSYLIGGVREEAGKVYYTRFGGNGQSWYTPVIDTLLFDFTLGINDTFNFAVEYFVVSEITFAADGRKIFHLNNTTSGYPITWVEGQGGRGLFTFDYTSYLYNNGSCFSTDPDNPCTIPCGVTSVNDPADNSLIIIYPNVVTDQVTMEWPGSQTANLAVFSADGKMIREVRQMSSGNQVDASSWSSGIYIFHLQFADGQRIVRKVVKRAD